MLFVQRGHCDDRVKAKLIFEAGGTRVAVCNNVTDIVNATRIYDTPIPVAGLNFEHGTGLLDLLESYYRADSSSPFTIQFTAKMVKVKFAGRTSCIYNKQKKITSILFF